MSDTIRAQLLEAYADEHRDHLTGLRAALEAGSAADFEEAYRHAHSLKGAARAVELPAVVDLAHGLESLLEAWWERRAIPDDDSIAAAARALDAIEDVSAAALVGVPLPSSQSAMKSLDAILERHGLCAPEPQEAQEEVPRTVPIATTTLRVAAEAADRLALSTTQLLVQLEYRREGESVLRRLGHDIELLASLVADTGLRASLAALRDTHAHVMRLLDEYDWDLSRAAQDLAEDVGRLRLVGAQGVLGNFGPMVRELAAEQGKEVRFDAEGLDTMVDRGVLAAAAEAAMHMLRNAVTHGLETPAERAASGKTPTGRLVLSVAVTPPRIEIKVADDGRGIDTARLAAEAVARGVMTAAQAERAEVDRLRQLVFLPGLSTAESLTTAAGRGMGMAIVRRVADRLQGQVRVVSQPGNGTEVVLSVPVGTLAQRLVLVCVHGQTFGLPSQSVSRLVELPASAPVRVDGEVLVLIDGREVPLAELGILLGLPGHPPVRDRLLAVLVHSATELVGLVVDSVSEVRELPVAPLEAPLADDPRLAGTVTLEQGVLAFVLAPAGLRVRGSQAAEVLAEPPPKRSPLVMVVDDSITTRTLERSILETHGYRVEVAVDGRDALNRLEELSPDVVVSDVEMPRLDGFGLLTAIRAHPRLGAVPVVLVTSRGADSDRKRGLALGADAYIVKTRFDQDDLLRIIGRLTS